MRCSTAILSVLAFSFLSVGCSSHPQTADSIRAEIGEALEKAAKKAETIGGRDEALNDYAAVAKQFPDSPEASMAYAKALRENGFPSDAVAVLSPFFVRKDVSEEITVEYIKDHIAAGLYPAAQRFSENRIEEEIKNLRAADKDPSPDKVYYASFPFYELLGVAYDAQGRTDEAEYRLRTALRLAQNKEDRARIMNNLALNLVHAKKITEAEGMITAAMTEEPYNAKIGRNYEWITGLKNSGNP